MHLLSAIVTTDDGSPDVIDAVDEVCECPDQRLLPSPAVSPALPDRKHLPAIAQDRRPAFTLPALERRSPTGVPRAENVSICGQSQRGKDGCDQPWRKVQAASHMFLDSMPQHLQGR